MKVSIFSDLALLAVAALHTASGFAYNQSSIGACYYQGMRISTKTYLSGGPGVNTSVYALCDEASGHVNCFTEGGARLPTCHQENRLGCIHHDGTEVHGYQQLQDDINGKKYYAVCDEASSELKCYHDDDTEHDHEQVSCDAAPPATAKQDVSQRDRRLAIYYNAGDKKVKPWPKGVVCYDWETEVFTRRSAAFQTIKQIKGIRGIFKRAWDYSAISDSQKQWLITNYGPGTKDTNRWFEVDPTYDVHTLLLKAFAKYEKHVGVEFIHRDACEARAKVLGPICNNCRHAALITFEMLRFKHNEDGTTTTERNPDYTCMAHMGYNVAGLPLYAQRMNLSPYCWDLGSMLHEVGHLVGLHHTHQHPDRNRHVIHFATGSLASMTTNYKKLPAAEVTGEYELHSVMHYTIDQSVCKPNREPTGRWCDVGETEGCEKATKDDCKTAENADVGIRGKLTEKDIARIKALYAEELTKRETAMAERKRPRADSDGDSDASANAKPDAKKKRKDSPGASETKPKPATANT